MLRSCLRAVDKPAHETLLNAAKRRTSDAMLAHLIVLSFPHDIRMLL
jgi:hypothetical protein